MYELNLESKQASHNVTLSSKIISVSLRSLKLKNKLPECKTEVHNEDDFAVYGICDIVTVSLYCLQDNKVKHVKLSDGN